MLVWVRPARRSRREELEREQYQGFLGVSTDPGIYMPGWSWRNWDAVYDLVSGRFK
jgi:hypothetical protein